jgi:REP element-mobilizing transposase RayT
MPQSLARVWLHVVFSTRQRKPLLLNEELREEMFHMLGHHSNEMGCPSAGVGGWADHVHVLCGLSRTVTIAQLLENLKRETSKWAKGRSPEWRDFYWQNGYGVFSVSQSNVAEVLAYIKDQPEHHATKTFQEEFRALCIRHGIEIDERYVWD